MFLSWVVLAALLNGLHLLVSHGSFHGWSFRCSSVGSLFFGAGFGAALSALFLLLAQLPGGACLLACLSTLCLILGLFTGLSDPCHWAVNALVAVLLLLLGCLWVTSALRPPNQHSAQDAPREAPR